MRVPIEPISLQFTHTHGQQDADEDFHFLECAVDGKSVLLDRIAICFVYEMVDHFWFYKDLEVTKWGLFDRRRRKAVFKVQITRKWVDIPSPIEILFNLGTDDCACRSLFVLLILYYNFFPFIIFTFFRTNFLHVLYIAFWKRISNLLNSS